MMGRNHSKFQIQNKDRGEAYREWKKGLFGFLRTEVVGHHGDEVFSLEETCAELGVIFGGEGHAADFFGFLSFFERGYYLVAKVGELIA